MNTRWTLPVFLAITLPAGAQQGQGTPVLFSVTAGGSLSTYVSRTPGNRSSGSLLPGPEAGFQADFPVTTACYLQPSLLYVEKGGRDRVTGNALTLSYLEIPMDFNFRPGLAKGNAFWVGFGPYIAYGIAGGDGSGQDPFRPDQGGTLERFDAGGHLQIGYQAPKGFLLGFSEQLGLANIRNDGTGNNAFRNNSFNLFLGYCFTGRKAP